jgi:deoxyribonuclease IV
LKLGAHMSIAGGFDKAVQRAHSVDSEALQVFTKNQNQWKARVIVDDEVVLFKQICTDCSIEHVVAHDSYLINLASPKDDLWEKSIDAFREELERCELLGIPYLVTHPGAHTGAGTDVGIARVIEALNRIHADLPGYEVRTLLETTAGQGSTLGATFDELSRIIAGVSETERVGVCFDTCHTFVAGYDLRTPEAYSETMMAFDEIIGLDRLMAIHLNDALKEFGSKRDRHAHIGKGFIGPGGFWNLMNDSRLAGIPALLETEKGDDLAEDREAITLLRSMIGAAWPGEAALATGDALATTAD